MSGAATTPATNRGPIHTECPVDQIEQVLSAGYTQANLRITRKAPDGKLASVDSDKLVDVKDLPNLDNYLRDKAGGGVFIIEARDPNNLRQYLFDRWQVVIEGMPTPLKPSIPAYMHAAAPTMFNSTGPANPAVLPPPPPGLTGMAPPGAAFQGPPSPMGSPISNQMRAQDMYDQYGQLRPPPDLSPWFRSFPIEQQWAIYQQQNPRAGVPTGASMYSDQAMAYAEQNTQRELFSAKTEAAKLHERLAAMEKELRLNVEKEREKAAEARLEAERSKHESELKSIRAEMEAWRAQQTQPKPDNGDTWIKAATALAPFAPVFIEWVKSNRHAQDSAANAQAKQVESLATALATKKEDGGGMEKVLPVVVPIFLKMLEMNSPQAKADLAQANFETQTAMLEFMSKMVQENASQQPETPWYLPVIERVLGTMQQAAMASQAQALLPPPQAAPQQVQVTARPVSTPAPAPTATLAGARAMDVLGDWSKLDAADANASHYTKMVFQHLDPKMGFHTMEWKILIFNLHHKLDAAEMAIVFADHMDHLANFEMLPELLQGVFENPAEVVAKLVGVLPIAAQDVEYAKAVVAAIVEEITRRNRELEKVEAETEEEVAAAEAEEEPAEVLEFMPAPKGNGRIQPDA